MHNIKLLRLLCIVAAVLFIPLTSYSVNKPSPDKTAIMAKTAKLQMPFIENKGQIKNKEVRFYANTFAGNVFVTEKGEVVYALRGAKGMEHGAKGSKKTLDSRRKTQDQGHETKDQKIETRSIALKESLIGSNIGKPEGLDKASTKVNYFVGNDKSSWKKDIPSYNEVSLGEVYKGIELKLKAYGKNVEAKREVKLLFSFATKTS